MTKPLPCHVVAGPLGAGKTTAILNFLRERPPSEFTAVVVNDFGKTGLDAEIIAKGSEDSVGEVEVVNVPGGCLCCSSIMHLETSIEKVTQLAQVTRLIIEPSGLAIMPDFLPQLRRLSEKYGLEIQPVIALINPRRVKLAHYDALPFFRSLVDNADYIVGNRVDECSPKDLQHFREWTAELDPRKALVLETSFGALPSQLFSVEGDEDRSSTTPVSRDDESHCHAASHHHGEASGGLELSPFGPVLADRVEDMLAALVRDGVDGAKLLRFKAVLKTDLGWRLYEIAEERVYQRDFADSDSAKIDWISEGVIEEQTMHALLQDCLPAVSLF